MKPISNWGFDCSDYVEGQGFAGGILLAWRSNSTTVVVLAKDKQFIHTELCFNRERPWFFTSVYVSPSEIQKKDFWTKMEDLGKQINGQWLVAGDFNDILSPVERKGGGKFNWHRATIFRDRLNRCGLMDLGAIGSKFIWKGHKHQGQKRLFERLDRALANSNWRLRFHETEVRVLQRIQFSNHNPLLISTHNVPHRHGIRPFRFEQAWTLHDSYRDHI